MVAASLTDAEISTLRGNANVAAVEDDAPCYVLGASQGPGHLVIEDQPSPQAETVPAGVTQIKASAAWDASRGKAIKVAVLGTGIDSTHPDLAPNYKGGISFVPSETSPMDFNGQGTHCAGTIAAALNNVGVVGVAPAAYLYAVKVLDRSGSGQFSWIIAGIDWCITDGIKIINMSLGGASALAVLEMICNLAWSKGLLLVAPAGHAGPPMGGSTSVGFPAKYATVIAVSAIDSSSVITNFSSTGPEVELCAPGVNVLSTVLGGGYSTMSGTSMACSHVSGESIRRFLCPTGDPSIISRRVSRHPALRGVTHGNC